MREGGQKEEGGAWRGRVGQMDSQMEKDKKEGHRRRRRGERGVKLLKTSADIIMMK